MRRLGVVALVLGAVGVIVLFFTRRGPVAPGSLARPAPQLRASGPAPLVAGMPFALWLGQPGLAARRVAGRVVFEGRPVGKAVVRITSGEISVGDWTLLARAADASGRFDFGPIPPGRYHVRAESPGRLAADEIVDLRAPDPQPRPDALELALGPCLMRVHGTVRDAAGGVIARARVRATRSGFKNLGNTVADDEGRYEVCAPTGPVHVEAVADGYGAAVVHASGIDEVRVDLALRPEVVIAGSVVGEDGTPVEGAVVTAATDGHLPGAMAESDAEGRFRMDGLSAMGYTLVARAGDRAAEKPIAPMAAGKTIEVVLTLGRRAALRGRVVAAGRPIAAATVHVLGVDAERDLGSAVSQADGRFTIVGLPRQRAPLRVDGYRLLKPARFDAEALGDGEVDLECEPLRSVSGRALAKGKPVADAVVHLRPKDASARELRESTQPDGTFKLVGVEPGQYELQAESGPAQALSGRQPLEVGGKDIEGLTLSLDLGATIGGVVVDAEGAPVADVAVNVFLTTGRDYGSGTTAADGAFLVTTLSGGGDYRVNVSLATNREVAYGPAVGRDFAPVPVPDGATHVTGLRLAISVGRLTISGRATRAGAPVADVDVRAAGSPSGSALAQTDADGSFTLTGLVAGGYRVVFEAHGSLLRAMGVVAAGTHDLAVDLPATGGIEGMLEGFHEMPSVSATRAVQPANGYSLPVEGTVADRSFAMGDLPAADYHVSAVDASGESATADVTVPADGVARVKLTAEPIAHVEGVVKMWPSGEPVAGANCQWTDDVNRSRESSRPIDADAAGVVTFGIPAGRFRINCWSRDGRTIPANEVVVDLAAGASATVQVLLIQI